MQVVYKSREANSEKGRWEVAWTWLPYFIATNPDVIKHVALEMTKRFQNREVNDDLIKEMHDTVIDLICDKIQIKGLRVYLTSLIAVLPGEPV